MANIQELKTMVQHHMYEWSEIPSDDIEFIRLSGFTNITYKVIHRKQ
jgi:hypothetical protein